GNKRSRDNDGQQPDRRSEAALRTVCARQILNGTRERPTLQRLHLSLPPRAAPTDRADFNFLARKELRELAEKQKSRIDLAEGPDQSSTSLRAQARMTSLSGRR